LTISEAHTAFKFGLDKFDSLNYPNFLPEEIDLLLNQAQDRFVKQRYGNNNNKQQSFEETQKRTEDLKNIVKNIIIAPAANTSENIDNNAQFVTLPVDHWFTVQERAEISYLDCKEDTVTDKVYVREVQHNDFDLLIGNPFEKPTKHKVLRLMANGKTELIHSSDSTITNYHLRYIKEPVRVNLSGNQTFELSSHTHQEIINLAVQIALEGIEAKRNQTFTPIIESKQE